MELIEYIILRRKQRYTLRLLNYPQTTAMQTHIRWYHGVLVSPIKDAYLFNHFQYIKLVNRGCLFICIIFNFVHQLSNYDSLYGWITPIYHFPCHRIPFFQLLFSSTIFLLYIVLIFLMIFFNSQISRLFAYILNF